MNLFSQINLELSTMDTAKIVQRQVDAYNAHDLEQFVAAYADSVRIFRMPSPEPAISGKAQLIDTYRARLSIPGLHVDVLSRVLLGNKVIDHEQIFGITDQPIELLAIYEISANLIETAWYFYPHQHFHHYADHEL